MHKPYDQLFPKLFVAVQTNGIFPDSKTFVDCSFNGSPDSINEAFEIESNQEGFKLNEFVLNHFDFPSAQESNFEINENHTAREHAIALWPYLTRSADKDNNNNSLIPLPHSYIVPGGRFGEIYYWDSFFTMLGLRVSRQTEMVQNMVDNFAFLIDEVGHIPNGNRNYFISRSQPPFFALMVELLAEIKGEEIKVSYLDQLIKEYTFWMSGEDLNKTNKRVVFINGHTLNRYWDDAPIPRQESYIEDVELGEHLNDLEQAQLYLDLRAACESGWDFSSRWFADGKNLSTICTTQIIPVDLNALLYQLELTIASAFRIVGQQQAGSSFQMKAQQRKNAINEIIWNNQLNIYSDFNFKENKHTDVPSAAMMFPLYMSLANQTQAEQVRDYLMSHLVKKDGVVCTNINSGQQWDAPNGWAPLQWISVQGLNNYGLRNDADDISKKWIDLNESVFAQNHKFVEKYNVEEGGLEAGGGEYPLQDGFGWSNGVYLALKAQ